MLQKRVLGNTGLLVTEFCLGILPMGPLQANVPQSECVKIIRRALDHGVNFIDTAENYKTQTYIGTAVQEKRRQVVIATKSIAATYDNMARSVEKSLTELNTNYIDIYHLHAGRATLNVFDERAGALQYLQKMKSEKVVRAVGISTHHVGIVELAAERDDIDVVFPLINKTGLGIVAGTREEMLRAINKASSRGKGLYAMKALGGGNLLTDLQGSLTWVRGIADISAVAVGVVSESELLMDLMLFGVEGIAEEGEALLIKEKRLQVLKGFCQGCGSCVEVCPNEAICLIDGEAQVDATKCILCGYCSPKCPQFALRII